MNKERILSIVKIIIMGGLIWAFGIFGVLITIIIYALINTFQKGGDNE